MGAPCSNRPGLKGLPDTVFRTPQLAFSRGLRLASLRIFAGIPAAVPDGFWSRLSLQSIAITQSRVLVKDDPRKALLEKQQQDIYRAAFQRSGRAWKAIAGRAISQAQLES